MIQIRFNLGRGDNYRKWKITKKDKSVIYLDPQKYQLVLHHTKTHNDKQKANKIYSGSNKRVCSWIQVKFIDINLIDIDITGLEELMYNPRKTPHWTNENGDDLDGVQYKKLITKGNKIYIENE